MSKIAELKADIPNFGNGVIINVYSSIEDMSNSQYTNDYIMVEAEYDGEYHKNCPIAVTYSRTNEAFEKYGTEWALTDANGNTCYVMTEPYLPDEYIITYGTPHISLSYETIEGGGGTVTPTGTYTQEWTDNRGGSGTEHDTFDPNAENIQNVAFRIYSTESNVSGTFSIDSSTGAFTSEGFVMTTDGTSDGTMQIATVRVSAMINGVYNTQSSTSTPVEQYCYQGNEYKVWLYDITQHSQYDWNATYYTNVYFTRLTISENTRLWNIPFTSATMPNVRSFNTREEALERPASEGGMQYILLPGTVQEAQWTADQIKPNEETTSGRANYEIELSDTY